TDQRDEAHRVGHEPYPYPRAAKAGGFRGDADIAGQSQLQSPAHAMTVNGGDYGRGKLFQGVVNGPKMLDKRPYRLFGELQLFSQIRAGAESAFPRTREDGAAHPLLLQRGECGKDFISHLSGQDVEGWVVDLQPPHRPLDPP